MARSDIGNHGAGTSQREFLERAWTSTSRHSGGIAPGHSGRRADRRQTGRNVVDEVRRRLAKHAEKAASPIPEGAGRHPLPGDTIGGQARAAADHDDMGPVGTLPHRGGTPRMEGTADRKSDHAWPGTALLAGTTAPRRAGFSLVQSRDTGRAADRTVEALAPLAAFSRDLRMMNPGDREEARALRPGPGNC